jgi:Asp-tRNA(Asn)/Glu-tRNA(Gln) amidotransferase A subunit family amidase
MEITPDQVAAAEHLASLSFTDDERELMLATLARQRAAFEQLRVVPLPNDVPPALAFDPQLAHPRAVSPTPREAFQPATTAVPLPSSHEGIAPMPAPESGSIAESDLAFATVTTLSRYIHERRVSAVELAELYLRRLEQYDPALRCVITPMGDQAIEQARRADAELAAGRSRGPLHGIPWGAKDLLATRGSRTTWGAGPYREQVFDEDASVVERLGNSGAVLLAKLSLGELAWGDVWYDATTKNPWNLDEGSSGSSAGSAAATAAGLVGFAIGSETYGSIVSPSTRCGTTGLRPTFGRVSRAGAMALSWSMDKLGPICRSAEDCALVFAAIFGPDGRDPTVLNRPFDWNPAIELKRLRIGYLAEAFTEERDGKANDDGVLETLRALGANLVPIALPAYPVEALSMILNVEAAAAFDELTRSDRDDLLVRQVEEAWPNVLRAARLIPAVEYLQANRVRTLVMSAMAEVMGRIDLCVAPSFGPGLLLTNLTGHPAVVLPNGFSAADTPTSITFTGRLYDEATLLAVAKAYQDATDFHLRRPPLFQSTRP